MMIRTLRLKNFRGVKEGEINFEPLTILLGPNNAGKTTILEALFLAPNPLRPTPYLIDPSRGNMAIVIVNSLHETLDSKGFVSLLYNYSSKNAEIECDTDGNTHSLGFISSMDRNSLYLTSNKTRSYNRVNIDNKEIVYSGRLSMSSEYTDSVTETTPFTENTLLISQDLIKAGYQYLRGNWASIVNSGVCKRVAEEASDFSSDKYKDITIEPFLGGQLTINAYFEDGRRIRLGDLGEGIQSYITAKILFEIEKPGILLWDDIEAHLNPRLLLDLGNWFSELIEEGRQVICTTHSIEAVRTLAGLNEEKVGIILTSLEKGILKTKKLSLAELEDLIKAGIDVRVAEKFLI